MEQLKKTNPTVIFVLDKHLIITSKKDNSEYRHSIDNAYRSYQLNPEMIEEIIESFAAASSDLIQGQNILIEKIIPLVRPVESVLENSYYSVFEKYNDQLIIQYYEELENVMRPLTKGRFDSLRISMDSLRRIAFQNLDSIVPLINREGENGSYRIDAGGDYESSLLLLSSFWSKETLPVDGEFVIAIPARGLLFVTGSNNKLEIDKLRETAAGEFRRREDGISEDLYKWNGSKFEIYK